MTTDLAPPIAPTEPPPPPPPGYPVRLMAGLPERSSRLLNFPFFIGSMIRALLLIPHYIALMFLGFVAVVVYFFATFAILFTGRFPRGMHDFVTGFLRWNANVGAYMMGLVDKYPPFSTEQADYPVVFQVDYPERSNRVLNFPFLGYYLKALLLIPHLFVVAALQLIAYLVLFVAQFIVLFSGRFPAGAHRFLLGVSRWSTRTSAYLFATTDKYLPFSLE